MRLEVQLEVEVVVVRPEVKEAELEEAEYLELPEEVVEETAVTEQVETEQEGEAVMEVDRLLQTTRPTLQREYWVCRSVLQPVRQVSEMQEHCLV